MTFIKTFKDNINNRDYEYNPQRTLVWNESNLRHMSYLKNSCTILYEKIESTYGEEYADYILKNVLKSNFKITQFDKYPLSEFPCLSERVFLEEYLHYAPLRTGGRRHSCNLNSFYTSAYREILHYSRRSASIELYDFLICFGLLLKKWIITGYCGYYFKHPEDVETFMRNVAGQLISAFFVKKDDIQFVTIPILDEKVFNSVLLSGDYSVIISENSQESLKATYDIYMEGLRFFFEFLLKNASGGRESYIAPYIKTYAYATNKTEPEILECIAHETGIHENVIFDIFKNVNFDAYPQCTNAPEYKEAFKRLSRIKTRKPGCSLEKIKEKIEAIFNTDYKNYLNMCSKKLSHFLSQYKLDERLNSYETIYYKKENKVLSRLAGNNFSEVTINSKFITENCKSEEEFKEKLYKAVLDAQAINQARLLLVPYKPQFNLNVKLEGLEESLISLACSVMSEATSYLKTTYNLGFTYEISQNIFFRDKSKKYTLKLG